MTYLRSVKTHKIIGCSPSGEIRPTKCLYCKGCILLESCNLEIIANIKEQGQFTLPQTFVNVDIDDNLDLEDYNEN